MRPSLVAVLALSLVGLSGAAMSDGMPAAKKAHYSKAKTPKPAKPHKHTQLCPPGHGDDSWAIAEQLNHEEWLRHRQDDLHRRGGHDDSISRYDDRYARDYAWERAPRGQRWERHQETWRNGEGQGSVEGARDGRGYGWAWRNDGRDADDGVERDVEGRDYAKGSSVYAGGYEGRSWSSRGGVETRGHGSHGGGQGWSGEYAQGDHGRQAGGRYVERRVYRSSGGDGHARGDRYSFGGGTARWNQGGYGDDEVYTGGSRGFDERTGEYRYGDDERYVDDDAVYAGGSRDFDERTGRYEGGRREHVVIERRRSGGGRQGGGYAYGGHASGGYASGGYSSGGHASSGHGYGGGYAGGGYGSSSSSYSSSSYGSSGYEDAYGYARRGGSRFHYDAGYAGRDEAGYLTWPGKAG